MAMPLEQRITYLENKYKELVFQMHGIRIEESAARTKNVSSYDPDHKVYKAVPPPSGEAKEGFALVQTTDKWEWTLSFNERVTGDYNFDRITNVADITPLAIYYNHTPGNDQDWLKAPYNIDRSANCDSVINVADITPIAVNFGKTLTGYNVYWQDSTGGGWMEIAELTVGGNRTQSLADGWTHRGYWQKVFTKVGIYDDSLPNPITVKTTVDDPLHPELDTFDVISVMPVFLTGEQDIRSENDTFKHTLNLVDYPNGNHAPAAELVALPSEIWITNPPTQIRFLAAGSTDQDGDSMAYQWDYDSSNGYSWIPNPAGPSSQTLYSYPLPYDSYTATVRVLDSVGDWGMDTVSVKVNPTNTSSPPKVDSFTVAPLLATLPATIGFTAVAGEIDGDSISSVNFSTDNDMVYETSFDSSDPEWTASGPNVTVSYNVNYTRDMPIISNVDHETPLDVRVKAVDDDGDSVPMISTLTLSHASPVINNVTLSAKVGYSDPNDPNDPVTVTVDAHDASDPDSPGDFPTRFVFNWGVGEGSTIENNGDGIASHDYNSPGSFQISVTCYDDDSTVMGGSCTTPEAHTFTYVWPEDEDGKVQVYGEPVVVGQDPELVDDGLHYGAHWTFLGDPSIALAINPETRQPSVVYTSTPPESCGIVNWQNIKPLLMCVYSQRTELGWPALPELVLDWQLVDAGHYVGQQCDLDFWAPVDFEQITLTPYISATFKLDGAGGGARGLMNYFKSDAGWSATRIPLQSINDWVSVRLVATSTSALPYVHYFDGVEGYPVLYEQGSVSGIQVVQYLVGASLLEQDHKPFLDDKTLGRTAALYINDTGTPALQYEVSETVSRYWLSQPETVSSSYPPLVAVGRSVALDFFGDTEVGALWIDSDYELIFRQKDASAQNWNAESEILVEDNVLTYCDFDYEENMGYPCVAYEQGFTQNELDYTGVYVDVYMNNQWLTQPILLDQMPGIVSTPLDLDISDGYVYVAYSKGGDIYSRAIDFFSGNR